VPLTGRFARYGNAFLAGVQQAAAAVPAPAGRAWEIRHEDTEADVVAAALAARRLIETEGCQVLIGALLSAPTATVALMADRYGVPLVSPTATHERLGLLGEHILQTNRTGPLEAEILARLACTILLKQRFAIIAADSPEAAAQAAEFREAVRRYGGEIVGEETYDPATTDFRAEIQRLRALRPEAVFAPATVDQMVLLGPQLDFYKVGALVLGPGEWNSARLLQRAGSVMERAIFPAGDIMFPAAWTADFAARWPAGQYDEEATRIARGAYLGTRLVLQTMAALEQSEGRVPARRLVAALRAGVTGAGLDLAAVDAYADAVRTIDGGQIVPFPAELYREAIARAARAEADTAADKGEPGDEPGEGTTGPPRTFAD
jgi:ABC-type branched-subunit amino acid transport system substrate-binding protein